MKREIIFRGKCVFVDKWIEGSLIVGKNGHCSILPIESDFIHQDREQVIPETVGQYTGVKDKNGIRIYEGDMVSTDLERPYNIVIYKNGCFMFECYDENLYHDIFFATSETDKEVYEFGEVIGNIHDNPELL